MELSDRVERTTKGVAHILYIVTTEDARKFAEEMRMTLAPALPLRRARDSAATL
jgi:hypothetical protein